MNFTLQMIVSCDISEYIVTIVFHCFDNVSLGWCMLLNRWWNFYIHMVTKNSCRFWYKIYNNISIGVKVVANGFGKIDVALAVIDTFELVWLIIYWHGMEFMPICKN